MNTSDRYLLRIEDRPQWLTYPQQLIELAEAADANLVPWHLCKVDAVLWDMSELKSRLGRDLVPFAHRQDCEDLACFEKHRGDSVLIIHDNTEPGWEDEALFRTFGDWLISAKQESLHWRQP